MNISTRWLREWVDPKVSDTELSEKLTMAGLEVERVAPVAPPFEGLVVGYVVILVFTATYKLFVAHLTFVKVLKLL